jgi:hypothetical protein
MYKINLVLMVLLAAAVVAAAAYLSTAVGPSAGTEAADSARLLRKLADADPDVRREGETGLRDLGELALPALREAAKSPDRALADRATRLLGEVEPARERTEELGTGDGPEPDGREAPVAFSIHCVRPRVGTGEGFRLYVRVRNGGAAPVVLLRQGPGLYALYGAHFEVTDRQGRVSRVSPEPAVPWSDGRESVAVGHGEVFDLYAGSPAGCALLSLREPGTYTVRFIYDAAEGSLYRAAVAGGAGVAALPPVRFASNELTLEVVD